MVLQHESAQTPGARDPPQTGSVHSTGRETLRGATNRRNHGRTLRTCAQPGDAAMAFRGTHSIRTARLNQAFTGADRAAATPPRRAGAPPPRLTGSRGPTGPCAARDGARSDRPAPSLRARSPARPDGGRWGCGRSRRGSSPPCRDPAGRSARGRAPARSRAPGLGFTCCESRNRSTMASSPREAARSWIRSNERSISGRASPGLGCLDVLEDRAHGSSFAGGSGLHRVPGDAAPQHADRAAPRVPGQDPKPPGLAALAGGCATRRRGAATGVDVARRAIDEGEPLVTVAIDDRRTADGPPRKALAEFAPRACKRARRPAVGFCVGAGCAGCPLRVRRSARARASRGRTADG